LFEKETPLLERVAAFYHQLSSVAAELNVVSDELGKSIIEIDTVLRKLSLGIATWVTIHGGRGDHSFWSLDIGYAKIDGNWGISLRKVVGDCRDHDSGKDKEWPYNDAPRSLRLEAIHKIPELLEKLSADAIETTKDLRARLGEAKAVAEAVKGAASGHARVPALVIESPTISKPDEALKTIPANKQIEHNNIPDALAVPTPATGTYN
jgi:hypothetical protein